MKAELKLPKSVFERFLLTGRPLAILNSDIYTIESNDHIKTENYWEYLGKRYGLFKSDSLRKFMNNQLIDGEDDIHSYISWVINFNYIRKLEEIASDFNQNLDYYKSIKQRSIDKLITDIFNIYNREQKNDISESIDIDTSMDSLPNIQELHKTDIFESLVPSPGIISIGKMCYSIVPGTANGNGSVVFDNKQYTLKEYSDLSDLNGNYASRLKAGIEKLAMSHGDKFKSQIKLFTEKNAKCKSDIKSTKELKDSDRMGNVGYQKVGNNYIFYAVVEPYLLKKDEKFYAFNAPRANGSKRVRVGSSFTIDSKTITINNSPQVLDMPYFHPFVHDSANICFNGNTRWTENNIRFSKKYKHDEPGLANKIVTLLYESQNALVNGANGDITPVYYFSRFKPVAKNMTQAINYARLHHIDERRIFDNDPKKK